MNFRVETKSVTGIDAPGNRPPWVVPEALEHLARTGAADLVAELLDDFRTDVAARLERLRGALATGDAATVKMEVHSIKGSAAQMGAGDLAAACRKLEVDAGADGWNLAGARVDTIQAEFDKVSADIGRHPLSRKETRLGDGI